MRLQDSHRLGVFKSCQQGHDLTTEDAYVYAGNGVRVCRECAKDAKGNIKKRPSFDMFRKD